MEGNLSDPLKIGSGLLSGPARGLRGDCFALRDLGEPRHHRCGIAVQDLLPRLLADIRFRERLAGPLAAEFGSVGAAHDALGAIQEIGRAHV